MTTGNQIAAAFVDFHGDSKLLATSIDEAIKAAVDDENKRVNALKDALANFYDDLAQCKAPLAEDNRDGVCPGACAEKFKERCRRADEAEATDIEWGDAEGTDA